MNVEVVMREMRILFAVIVTTAAIGSSAPCARGDEDLTVRCSAPPSLALGKIFPALGTPALPDLDMDAQERADRYHGMDVRAILDGSDEGAREPLDGDVFLNAPSDLMGDDGYLSDVGGGWRAYAQEDVFGGRIRRRRLDEYPELLPPVADGESYRGALESVERDWGLSADTSRID